MDGVVTHITGKPRVEIVGIHVIVREITIIVGNEVVVDC
jgi:hypothetical protein